MRSSFKNFFWIHYTSASTRSVLPALARFYPICDWAVKFRKQTSRSIPKIKFPTRNEHLTQTSTSQHFQLVINSQFSNMSINHITCQQITLVDINFTFLSQKPLIKTEPTYITSQIPFINSKSNHDNQNESHTQNKSHGQVNSRPQQRTTRPSSNSKSNHINTWL